VIRARGGRGPEWPTIWIWSFLAGALKGDDRPGPLVALESELSRAVFRRYAPALGRRLLHHGIVAATSSEIGKLHGAWRSEFVLTWNAAFPKTHDVAFPMGRNLLAWILKCPWSTLCPKLGQRAKHVLRGVGTARGRRRWCEVVGVLVTRRLPTRPSCSSLKRGKLRRAPQRHPSDQLSIDRFLNVTRPAPRKAVAFFVSANLPLWLVESSYCRDQGNSPIFSRRQLRATIISHAAQLGADRPARSQQEASRKSSFWAEYTYSRYIPDDEWFCGVLEEITEDLREWTCGPLWASRSWQELARAITGHPWSSLALSLHLYHQY